MADNSKNGHHPANLSPTFLTRVELKDYKSIASCNVEMRPLMFIIGRNGAGKSNFLDALRFVADALRDSLDHAIRQRGGIHEVRRRSGGHPTHFSIRLSFRLSSGETGFYAFRIGGGNEVQEEECLVYVAEPALQMQQKHSFYKVSHGTLEKHNMQVAPAIVPDRLYLVNAAGLPEFRPLYEALSHMGFYNFNPDVMREWQAPDTGELLLRDGGNITSVLNHLATSDYKKQRLQEFLAKVVPGVSRVETKMVGPRETLEFRQEIAGRKDPWRFYASSMSDGTLRTLGVIVALLQSYPGNGRRVSLIGIEEPETALHPAAASVLRDSLLEASQSTQILITSHSPDLLDDKDLDPETILFAYAEGGKTGLVPLDEIGKTAIRQHLYTAGELLRTGQARPDLTQLQQLGFKELELEGVF